VSTLVPQGEAAEFELDTLGESCIAHCESVYSAKVGSHFMCWYSCMPSRERAEDAANAHLIMTSW